MIAFTKKETKSRDKDLQENFLAMLPIIVRCARVAFRNLAPKVADCDREGDDAAAPLLAVSG
jgi:hypothetical protein